MAYLPTVVLLWLAFFFGRTLRQGAMPLIERIARCGKPALSAPLCRYTRRLTALWSAYFVLAALVSAGVNVLGVRAWAALNAVVWAGTLLLFVGEHSVRKRLFPDEQFPGLLQQVRDTWSIWRGPAPAGAKAGAIAAVHADTRADTRADARAAENTPPR